MSEYPKNERQAAFDLDEHVARVERTNDQWHRFERRRRASDVFAQAVEQAARDAAFVRWHRRMELALMAFGATCIVGVIVAVINGWV